MNTKICIVLIVCFVLLLGVARNRANKAQIKKMLQSGTLVIDVRSEQEYSAGHFDGALNIPYDECADRLSELGNNKDRPIVLYCHAGSRSAVAHEILRKNGFIHVINARSYAVMKRFEKVS